VLLCLSFIAHGMASAGGIKRELESRARSLEWVYNPDTGEYEWVNDGTDDDWWNDDDDDNTDNNGDGGTGDDTDTGG